MSTDMLNTAYHALCQPIMTYGLNWGEATSWHDVFGLQRRAVRIIDKLQYRDDCSDSFSRLRILTFPCLYILECVLFVQKNLNRFTLHEHVHGYHTRGRNNLKPDFCRLSKSQKSVNCTSIKFYNKLPISIRKLPIQKFKAAVKRFLLDRAFYSYEEFLGCPVAPENFEITNNE